MKPGASVKAGAKAKPAGAAAKKPKPRKPTPQEEARKWARQLERKRPGLVEWTLEHLAGHYGTPVWERHDDPTTQLVLTILSQNSADTNAEVAFEELRAAYPSVAMADAAAAPLRARDGWGGLGIRDLPPPDWDRVENAPLPELIEVIRPGGLAPQKAPRIQASLAAIHQAAGGHSLEFLAEMPALAAREWFTQIPGIGPKTASVVLLFSYGTPLMPVDRHVERVSTRIGLLPAKGTAQQYHDFYLELVPPERMYEAHVNLIRHGRAICHAQRPECGRCPVAERCRYVNPKAP